MKYLCLWTLCIYIWQHVNNQNDDIFQRNFLLFFFFLFSPFCFYLCFLFMMLSATSWKNLFIHIYISCSDVTPFHSARQYVSTGFELACQMRSEFCLIQRGFQLYMLFVYKQFPAQWWTHHSYINHMSFHKRKKRQCCAPSAQKSDDYRCPSALFLRLCTVFSAHCPNCGLSRDEKMPNASLN